MSVKVCGCHYVRVQETRFVFLPPHFLPSSFLLLLSSFLLPPPPPLPLPPPPLLPSSLLLLLPPPPSSSSLPPPPLLLLLQDTSQDTSQGPHTPPEEDWSPRQPHTPADSPPHSPKEDKVRNSSLPRYGRQLVLLPYLGGGGEGAFDIVFPSPSLFLFPFSFFFCYMYLDPSLFCIHPLPLLPSSTARSPSQ